MDDLILQQPLHTGGWGRAFAPRDGSGGQFSEAALPWVLCGAGASEGSPPGEPQGRLPPGTLELIHLF